MQIRSILISLGIGASLAASPKISIITSVYDGDAFIEGFLQDIVKQTVFDQCELILINAASPGNEETVINKYLKKYPNIIYKKLNSDPGIYGTWNNALALAHGEYITNANLDDRLAETCYQVHAAYLDAHNSVDFVYSDKYITYQQHETFAKNTGIKWPPSPQITRETFNECWPCSNPMWRKSLHDRYGLFDATYKSSGDWEFWLRVMEGGAVFKKINGYYLLYYHNPQGLSTGKRTPEKNAEDKKIIDRYGYMWGAPSYRTYYSMARSLDMQCKDNSVLWSSALNYYLMAYTLKPHRAEPLVRIAHHYIQSNEPSLAFIFANQAAKIVCSSSEDSIEHELYDYARYDILGRAAWYVNEFEVGEQALHAIVEKYPDLLHLRSNLAFYLERKKRT